MGLAWHSFKVFLESLEVPDSFPHLISLVSVPLNIKFNNTLQPDKKNARRRGRKKKEEVGGGREKEENSD